MSAVEPEGLIVTISQASTMGCYTRIMHRCTIETRRVMGQLVRNTYS
ncbi:MAG: hypothetical protein ABJD13_01490 [Paracoccaceae bacterium]